jgi:hypothetical protein
MFPKVRYWGFLNNLFYRGKYEFHCLVEMGKLSFGFKKISLKNNIGDISDFKNQTFEACEGHES